MYGVMQKIIKQLHSAHAGIFQDAYSTDPTPVLNAKHNAKCGHLKETHFAL
jgi:hypothetical protein